MRLSKSWIIASKELKVFRKKRNILYSTFTVPLAMSILLPLVIDYSSGESAAGLTGLLNGFSFWFVIVAAILPTAIASYAIIGEKVEKSLEPLLATPTTDGEILLGKSIAALLPPTIAIYTGAFIFTVLMDVITSSKLGYLYYPNWNIVVVLLFMVPLAAILSIQLNVIVSSRVNDVRAAQQIGIFTVMPLLAVQLATELSLITLGIDDFLVMSAILLAIDLALFYFSTATLRREEILTSWK